MADDVIGRSGELLALAAFVEAVPNTGQALLLEGEAGIGKTALWEEGLRLADERRLARPQIEVESFGDADRVRNDR